MEKIEERLPIYVESLLSAIEYREMYHLYLNTYNSPTYRGVERFREDQYRWRWRMGLSLLPEEMANINYNLEYLRKQVNPQ